MNQQAILISVIFLGIYFFVLNKFILPFSSKNTKGKEKILLPVKSEDTIPKQINSFMPQSKKAVIDVNLEVKLSASPAAQLNTLFDQFASKSAKVDTLFTLSDSYSITDEPVLDSHNEIPDIGDEFNNYTSSEPEPEFLYTADFDSDTAHENIHDYDGLVLNSDPPPVQEDNNDLLIIDGFADNIFSDHVQEPIIPIKKKNKIKDKPSKEDLIKQFGDFDYEIKPPENPA